MNCQRLAVVLLVVLAASFQAFAQTVISTHSGTVYFFEGSVWLGDQRLEQKFGKFPTIGEGGELRTQDGRAEVLLTPGVFLRMGENSRVRLVSSNLADTRVELLDGSAVIEAKDPSADTSATVSYKGWQIKVPERGIYRIDTVPPQVKVYKGEAQVVAEGNKDTVAVKDGQVLPLAGVLVADASQGELNDSFDRWAMERSQAIYSDNATASEIIDDPTLTDSAGLALGGLSYFPITSSPALGLANPYGLSFWSPFQPSLNSLYLRGVGLGWAYPTYVGYPGLRLFQLYPLRPLRPGSPTIGTVGGYQPIGGGTTRFPVTNRIPPPVVPHTPSHPVGGVHPAVHAGHR
jgi:FecR-like protein